jgi:hypothetical protein
MTRPFCSHDCTQQDFEMLQSVLLVAGVDLAGVEVALLPNTLLLELPSGWYAWPPPSELSGAASVASAAAIEAARASSLVSHWAKSFPR